jgi:L-threonylcarbamoyladenylate synthase
MNQSICASSKQDLRNCSLTTKHFNTNELTAAANILRSGGLIAFPTETVYGLGADATSDAACKKIYVAKGRPSDNPFIVHVCDIAAAEQVAHVCSMSRKLFENFSPGPITVVMKRKPIICNTATAGLDSVGVRIPLHPVAQKFLELCAIPVAAPSANISGQLSPTTADMVMRDLSGRIDGIIESDDIDCGLESTVVSVLDGEVRLLRAGAISLEQLEECLGCSVTIADEVKEGKPMHSPGQKYKHYSPKIPLELIDTVMSSGMQCSRDIALQKYTNEKIGLLLVDTDLSLARMSTSVPTLAGADLQSVSKNWHIKTFKTLEDYARGLYRTMDEMGRNGCTRIIAVLPPDIGIGRAIRNRLIRASGGLKK